MDHVAIMKKSWKLIDRIVDGMKKVESRWYKTRRAPWDCVTEGDVVYFKDSGEPVTARATVDKVVQYADLDASKVDEILSEYGTDLGIHKEDRPYFYSAFGDKRYCILVFLRDAEKIEPFRIDKTGYAIASAWLTVENIDMLRK